jgi:hypothetical protein
MAIVITPNSFQDNSATFMQEQRISDSLPHVMEWINEADPDAVLTFNKAASTAWNAIVKASKRFDPEGAPWLVYAKSAVCHAIQRDVDSPDSHQTFSERCSEIFYNASEKNKA